MKKRQSDNFGLLKVTGDEIEKFSIISDCRNFSVDIFLLNKQVIGAKFVKSALMAGYLC